MNISMRPAVPADLEEILGVAGESPEAPQWASSSYLPFLIPESPEGQGPLLRQAFVAAAGGHVLGFAAASLLLDGEENRAELESIAVMQSARRRGIGLALVQSVLSWAARHGGRRLTLEVRASSLAAIGLYEAAGLKAEGLRRRYYADPEDDALLMSTAITSAPLPPGVFHGETG